jgi:Ca2+-binding RTX toxin-like protein
VAVLSVGILLAPAVSLAASTTSVSVAGSQVVIEGGSERDYVTINSSTAAACPGGAPCYLVTNGGSANVIAPVVPCVAYALFPGWTGALCPRSGIERIVLSGHDGNDYISVGRFAGLDSLVVPLTIRGDRGEDHIEGGKAGDLLVGGTERDHIDAGPGGDRVLGSDGNDSLNGDRGHDFLTGGAGDDGAYGDGGRDVIVGGAGADFLGGGVGADRLRGGAGVDFVSGAPGRDRCNGGTDPAKQNDKPRGCEVAVNFP